jgi:hypothetical protein
MNREQMIGEVCNQDDRVQYDGKDEVRVALGAQFLSQGAVLAIEGLGRYRDAIVAPVNEDTADDMKAARYDAILGLATLQIGLSKLAWMLRIDFDEAFRRCVEAGPTEEDPELNDL